MNENEWQRDVVSVLNYTRAWGSGAHMALSCLVKLAKGSGTSALKALAFHATRYNEIQCTEVAKRELGKYFFLCVKIQFIK